MFKIIDNLFVNAYFTFGEGEWGYYLIVLVDLKTNVKNTRRPFVVLVVLNYLL